MNQKLLTYSVSDTGIGYTGELISSLILPLFGVIAVVLLAYAFTKWLSKRYQGMSSGRCVQVVERLPVGKDRDLLLIRMNGQAYLLGVTGHGITTICSFPASELPDKPEAGQAGFKSVLETVLRQNRFFDPRGERGGDGEQK